MPDLSAEADVVTRSGRALRLRPIQRDDAAALVDLGLRTTPEDLRLRFFGVVRPEVGFLTDRLTQFDRSGHVAAAVFDPISPGGAKELLGVVRLVIDDDGRSAEFAILVRSDQQRQGIGRCLMTQMLAWARTLAIGRVEGLILRENSVMINFMKSLGGVVVARADDPTTVKIRFCIPIGGDDE